MPRTATKIKDAKDLMREKFLEEHPNFDDKENRDGRNGIALPAVVVTPMNASEVLVGAVNKVIEVYNKIASSITDTDIKKMKASEKILALQKLSYLHTATKKMKPNMNFIKIDTTNAGAKELEDALLNLNNEETTKDEL